MAARQLWNRAIRRLPGGTTGLQCHPSHHFSWSNISYSPNKTLSSDGIRCPVKVRSMLETTYIEG